MASKPTYEELEQSIKALEKESAEKKQAMEVLRDSENKYRTFFENSLDPLFITIPEGRILEANPAACEMFGYTEEELIQGGRNAVVDLDDKRLPPALEERARTGKFIGELTFKRKDGTKFPTEITSVIFKDRDGVEWAGIIIRDITERRRAEKALRESEERYRILLQNANDAVYVHAVTPDGPGRFIEVNDRACRMLGYTYAEFMTMDIPAIDVPEQQARIPEILQQLFKTGHAIFETEQMAKNRRRIPVEVSARLFEFRGVPTVLSVVRDITERKRVENTLRESEEKFKAIFEGSHDAITLTAENGKVIDCNHSALELFGLDDKEDFKNKRPADFSPKFQADGRESQEAARQYIDRVIQSGKAQRFEWLHQNSNGEVIPTEIILTSYLLKGERVLQASIRDITDRKKTEEALRESEAFTRAVMNYLPIGVAVNSVDPAVNFTYMNDNFLKYYRTTREALSTPDSFWDAVYEEPKFREEIKRRVLDDCAGGDPKHMSWKDVPITRKGEETTFISAMNTPIPGKPLMISTVWDVTERKRAEAERAKLQDQLVQAQKMESVGRLAGGVAHDFNNMLGVILGRTEMILMGMKPGDPHHADLEEIHKATRRSADLTRQLLAFARKQTIAPKVLDLNDTMERMLKMLRRLIGEEIDLIWKPNTHLWSVKMDPAQLDQILANLCVNARDAIAGTGNLIIETENIVLDDAYCTDHMGFVPGEYVMLTVNDDGCGMDKETLEHLFEPFFTTKEVGKGTGLGLATVYGIVKQNNGFVNVYTEPGKGATFKIYIPRLEEDLINEKTSGPKESPKGHGEIVLLVEDDPGILSMGKAMLERLGYAVLTSGDPGQALNLAKEHSGKIHLLMTDVVMPQMSGKDMAKQIHALKPEIKVLFMSGYTADVIAHRGILEENVQFIQKPFSIKELAAKVRQVLEQE